MSRLALILAAACIAAPGLAQADPCEAPLPRKGEAFAGQVRYVGATAIHANQIGITLVADHGRVITVKPQSKRGVEP